MIATQEFISCNEKVLENVFGTKVTRSELHRSIDRDGLFEDDVVASIQVEGNYTGQVAFIIPKEGIPKVIALILRKYEVDIPVKERVVFAEMINIFAANLITCLLPYGIVLSISPPDAAASARHEGNTSLLVTMETDTGFPFSVYYALNEGLV